MSLLIIDDLSIRAGDLSLVDGVSLSVAAGEVVALVGESGSGKSLTALSIMGLLSNGLERHRGSIHFDGVDLTSLSQMQLRELRGSELAMIFQEPVSSLNPLAAVGAQVAESLIVHGRASSKDAALQAVAMLERVGIPEPQRRALQLPTELSGGMCQRVMIAAALISNPRLLIADEPTTALDVTIQAQILALMSDLAAAVRTATLLITHDMGVVAERADKVCVMYGGRIVEQGDVFEIFANPKHPYTSMLLKTIPRLDDLPKKELFAISGYVPSPSDWPTGCRFRPRCDRADNMCTVRPILKEPDGLEGNTHRVACHHALGNNT